MEEGEPSVSSRAPAPPPATDSAEKAPVVKAKATHVIMSSLITSKRLRPRNRVRWGRGELSPRSQLPRALHARLPQPVLSEPRRGQPGCPGGTSAEAPLRREVDPVLSIVVHSGLQPCFPLPISVPRGKLS